MENKYLKIREGLIVEYPLTPNFLLDYNGNSVHPIERLTDGELEFLAEKWKEKLIRTARKRRNKNQNYDQ